MTSSLPLDPRNFLTRCHISSRSLSTPLYANEAPASLDAVSSLEISAGSSFNPGSTGSTFTPTLTPASAKRFIAISTPRALDAPGSSALLSSSSTVVRLHTIAHLSLYLECRSRSLRMVADFVKI
jgi:hypothetical protein